MLVVSWICGLKPSSLASSLSFLTQASFHTYSSSRPLDLILQRLQSSSLSILQPLPVKMSSSHRRGNGSSGSNRPSGSARPSTSHHSHSSSGYSDISSVAEIQPGQGRGQASNTAFYSMGNVVGGGVNRPASSSSVPPYSGSRPPTYHSQGSAGHRPSGSGSGSGGRPPSDPPSYHSPSPRQSQQQQGYGQQQQYQQPPAPRPQQQPSSSQYLQAPGQGQGGPSGSGSASGRGNWLRRSSERLKKTFHLGKKK